MPGKDSVIAGAFDEIPAKCFSIKTGEVVHEFDHLEDGCMTLDISRDGQLVGFGDNKGVIHIYNINTEPKKKKSSRKT